MKHISKEMIPLCLIFIMILSGICIKASMATVERIVGKQQNYQMQGEPIHTEIEQSIEKYLNIEDNQVLLQQKVVVHVNRNDIKKESEKLEIEVPSLQDIQPSTVVVLKDGKVVDSQSYQYDVPNHQLQIQTFEEGVGTYKMIYHYPNTSAQPQEIQLKTKAHTKFENAEEKEIQDEKTVSLTSMGQKVSVQEEMTKEVYKGYLYEAKESQTKYDENYKIEVSNTQNIEGINLNKEREIIAYATGEEAEIPNNTYFIQTKINKEQMLRILGEEGKMTIQDGQGGVLGEFTKDSQEDEKGDFILNYTDKEVKDIKVVTTKPVQLGEIKIQNQKAMDTNTGYTREQIEKFEYLENIIRVNESIDTARMALLDTKSEAVISMNRNELSTLQKNENIQMTVTLKSNSYEYDLYKNPVIEIQFPQEMEIDIKNITQLNFGDVMKITQAGIEENEDGRKILRIFMEGEQITYLDNIEEGIQIAIIGDVTISNKVPSKEVNLEVSCQNEKKEVEGEKTQYPVKIHSKDGIFMINQMENYNQAQEVMETVDDKEVTLPFDIFSEERIARQTIHVMNNYETPITELCLIGNLSEEKEAMDIDFQDIVILQEKNAKIYYSDKSLTDKNSEQWKENKEEVEKIKSYKIVIEDEIQPEESITIQPSLYIPENLNAGNMNYIKNIVTYQNLGKLETIQSSIKCTTRMQQERMFLATRTNEEIEGVKVEIAATSGGKYLEEGETVKEGQGICYQIKLTNVSDSELSNIVLEATNTNAIYYDTISYEENVNEVICTKYKIEENENLTSKILKVDSLQPGEEKQVSYQISAKQVGDNNQEITGQIKVKADNLEERTIENITNKIEKGLIKTTLRFSYSEDVLTNSYSDVPLMVHVQNISDNVLQNVIVKLPVAEGYLFREENLMIEEGAPFEFLGYEEGIVKFRIPKIEAKETISVDIKLDVEEMELEKTQQLISQYAKVVHNDVEYISNDVERLVKQAKTKIEVKQTTDRQEQNVKDGDSIKFFTTIKNTGAVNTNISILDTIPDGLVVENATMKTKEEERKLEIVDNILQESVMIEPGEIIEIEMTTIVKEEEAVDIKLENYVRVVGVEITEESEKIVFFIEVEGDDEEDDNNEVIIYPDDDDDDNDNPNGDHKDDDNGNQTPGEKKVYSVSGTAWIDANEDGVKDSSEEGMANVPVFLIDDTTGKIVVNDDETELTTTTEADGSYYFNKVKPGQYIVVFQYNTGNYMVTTYQKEGVNQDMNSDVIQGSIKLGNREITIAKTQTLELNAENLKNIDAGFKQGKIFDLKLEKSIQKVIVQNNKGTKEDIYQQSKLAKVEMDAKDLAKSNVLIEYHMAVTNQGEIAGYVNELIDNMPKDLIFNSELNPSWYQTTDGALATKELSNQLIQPGETKNVTLILLKKMTQDNTGTLTNQATIQKSSNDYRIEDANKNNNVSQAELIISVRTGRVVFYISLVITIVIGLAVGIYLIKRKIL